MGMLLDPGRRSTAGSRQTEDLVDGSRRAEDLVDGSRQAEDLVDGSRQAEDLVDGSRQAEDLVDGSRTCWACCWIRASRGPGLDPGRLVEDLVDGSRHWTSGAGLGQRIQALGQRSRVGRARARLVSSSLGSGQQYRGQCRQLKRGSHAVIVEVAVAVARGTIQQSFCTYACPLICYQYYLRMVDLTSHHHQHRCAGLLTSGCFFLVVGSSEQRPPVRSHVPYVCVCIF